MTVKINKSIEIVRSTKTWLSSMSMSSARSIASTLNNKYTKVTVTNVDNLDDLNQLVNRQPDLVFLGMKFIIDESLEGDSLCEKIWISNYLDEFGIRYTGSNKLAHERSVKKSSAKENVIDAGLATSPFFVIDQADCDRINMPDDLSFPLFVKPNNRGGGLGVNSMSVVNNVDELKAKAYTISHDLGSDSIIENYLTGREFSVAIFDNIDREDSDVMPIEIIAPVDEFGFRILGNVVKSANQETILAVSDPILRSSICRLALKSFMALGAREFGRIDIRIDDKGNPQFLEANLIPSLIAGYGSFPKSCFLNENIEFENMIFRIVDLAFVRDETHQMTEILQSS